MKRKVLETAGYVVNGVSIALFIYLASVLDVPDGLSALAYLGWILVGAGAALIVLSIAGLVSNRGAGLSDRGIYGLVRHPMYLGAIMCFLSFFFFLPHWLIFVISSVNIAVVYGFILQGDQQNITTFGDAYRRYMDAVPGMNLLAGIARRLQSR
jgi:protein-S-isoprenylcysteine O-methyltransferase Ste14